jgi:hypothetical protein
VPRKLGRWRRPRSNEHILTLKPIYKPWLLENETKLIAPLNFLLKKKRERP